MRKERNETRERHIQTQTEIDRGRDTERETHRETEGDRQTDRQTGRHTGRQAGRHSNRHTERANRSLKTRNTDFFFIFTLFRQWCPVLFCRRRRSQAKGATREDDTRRNQRISSGHSDENVYYNINDTVTTTGLQ